MMFRSLARVACATLLVSSAAAAELQGNWPGWRGPDRSGVNRETGLLNEWPEAGPTRLWEVNHVGVGYSSLAVRDGRIVTQGDLNGVEHIICLSEKDGSVFWAVQPEPVRAELAERIKKELARLDKNSDGVVDEAEALAGLGWRFNESDQELVDGDTAAIAEQRASGVFKQLDANNDQRLDFDEVGRWFRDVYPSIDRPVQDADAGTLARTRAQAALKQFDKDRDGKISRDESKQTLLDRPFNRIDQKAEGERRGDELLTFEELEAYFAKFEAGQDGLLTQDELRSYYVRALPRRDGQLTEAELRGHFGGYRNGQGDGPRGTPIIDGDRVYAEGGNGDLTCLDFETGKTLWHVNLVRDFQGGRPGWGYSESPLVVGGMLIVTPGGKDGTVLALNKLTGEPIWRSEKAKESAHYSSPVLAEIHGVKQIVQFARESCFGVTLNSGELLWNYKNANNGTANCATPIVHRNHVFASSSYGTGGGLAKIDGDGQQQQAAEVYFEKSMANHHGGIVLFGDHMYGFGNGGLICMNYLTGEIAWKARSVGKGSLVIADRMLYLLGERHEVALAEVTPEEYRETGRFKIESLGRPSWAHPVVTGGRFYIRNQGRLTAYDVRASAE